MLALISVVLFSVAVSAAPPVTKVTVAAPPSIIPGAQNLPLPVARAAYIPTLVQANYEPQRLVKTAATVLTVPVVAATALRAAPILTTTAVRAAPVLTTTALRATPVLTTTEVRSAPKPQWAIVRSNLDNNFDGSFQFDYETENGISVMNSGYLKQVAPEKMGQVMEGQYSYTAPDGQIITTYYTADENGFVARGDHLPQAPLEPELPPLIAKSLAYIRSLPLRPEFQE